MLKTKKQYSNNKFLFPIHCSLFTVRGQSLFEVIIAVGLSALILSGVVSLAATSVRNSSFTRNNAQATKYAQEAMEWLRGQRDSGWTNLSSHSDASGLFSCLNTLPPSTWGSVCSGTITDTIFVRDVTLTLVNSSRIDALVNVSWTDAQGTHNVESQTRFTNWR